MPQRLSQKAKEPSYLFTEKLLNLARQKKRTKIQRTPKTCLLVLVALIEKLAFGSGFETANIVLIPRWIDRT